MSGVNKVILLGRLTRDPEMKDANGLKIANFSIATSKQWKDEGGEKKEKAEFHNCVAFRKTAELVGKYLTKGRQVYLDGELQTRSWEDESGKKHYRTEIIANNIQFIGGQNDKSETSEQQPIAPPGGFDQHEEIPF